MIMTKEELDNITCYIKENVMRNEDVVFDNGKYTDFMLDLIATLHNYLYKEVTGEPYNYMFHWYNKVTGTCNIEDDMFSMLEEGDKS